MAARSVSQTLVYGYQVPGGKTQAPLFGSQFPAQARGCTAQIGGNVRRPPTTEPPGVWIMYGPGAGVGSALATATFVEVAANRTTAATTSFIARSFR